MIQYWLKDRLAEVLPDLLLTADYQPDSKTYATVFYEGGGEPGRYDLKYQTLRYMVWVESDDWGFAEYVARKVFLALHEYPERPVIEVDYLDKDNVLLLREYVMLHSLSAAGEVNPLGVLEGKRRYSVNFDATITLKKEESPNG